MQNSQLDYRIIANKLTLFETELDNLSDLREDQQQPPTETEAVDKSGQGSSDELESFEEEKQTLPAEQVSQEELKALEEEEEKTGGQTVQTADGTDQEATPPEMPSGDGDAVDEVRYFF